MGYRYFMLRTWYSVNPASFYSTYCMGSHNPSPIKPSHSNGDASRPIVGIRISDCFDISIQADLDSPNFHLTRGPQARWRRVLCLFSFFEHKKSSRSEFLLFDDAKTGDSFPAEPMRSHMSDRAVRGLGTLPLIIPHVDSASTGFDQGGRDIQFGRGSRLFTSGKR